MVPPMEIMEIFGREGSCFIPPWEIFFSGDVVFTSMERIFDFSMLMLYPDSNFNVSSDFDGDGMKIPENS